MSEVGSNKVDVGKSAQIISVLVGKEKQQWSIPMDLLCFHSGYFRSTLKGGFAEGKSKTVELLNAKPEAFELIVEWLYTHEIKTSGRDNPSDIYTEKPNIATLLEAWMLADYLQLRKLQNTIMKLMDERMTHYGEVPVEEFNRAYQDYTDPHLRAWILDAYVWAIPDDNELVDYFDEQSDFELLQDILRQMLRGVLTGAKERFVLNEDHLVPE
ncbi:hypothetical protein V502_10145 [Pseudogymnoascus sp. VKM F-4520 (FW-2644)]|nr:hypothetical protein V502_10145 [Pseudogymnoascus sp. VKM F-4520 (FW-2644)]